MRRRRKLRNTIVSYLIVALLVLPGFGQQVSANENGEVANQNGMTALNESDKNVLGTLTMNGVSLEGVVFSIHSVTSEIWYDTVTNTEGIFGFALPDGDYQLDGIWLEAEGKWYPLSRAFTVENGNLIGDAELKIELSSNGLPTSEAIIDGLLTKGGNPVLNTQFSIHTIDGSDLWYSATTDTNGLFKLILPDGEYQLDGVWLDEEGNWYQLNKILQVNDGLIEGSPKINIELIQPEVPVKQQVNGLVTKDGQPVPNEVFSIHTLDGSDLWFDTITNNAGEYSVVNLPDGEYQVDGIWVSSENKWYPLNKVITVNGSTEINIEISSNQQPKDIYKVTGKVTNASVAKAGEVFSIHTTDENVQWFDTTTDEFGNFMFELPEGKYQIDGFWSNKDNKWYPLEKVFLVEGNMNLELELTPLQADINVSGEVIESGKSISNVWVSVHTLGVEELWYDYRVGESGRFEFTLPDGEYQIDGIWVESESEWYPLNRVFSVVNGVLVESAELILELNQFTSTNVQGAVQDVNGPIINAGLYVYDENDNWQFVKADSKGEFSVSLPDGNYQVIEVYYDERNFTDVDLAFTVENGVIFINSVETSLLTITLPVITFNGILQDESGAIPNAVFYMWMINDDSYEGVGWYSTGSNGRFLDRLVDGKYYIERMNLENELNDAVVKTEFEIKNGLLYVNGEKREILEINIPSKTITGNIQDVNGIGANTSFLINSYNGRYYNDIDWFKTDENGNFSARLEDGRYSFSNITVGNIASFDNYYFELKNGLIIVDGEYKEQLEIALPLMNLVGQTMDENGTVPNGELSFYGFSGDSYQQIGWMNSDENGNYSARLSDGLYYVSNTYLDNEANLTFTNKYFEIKNGKLQVDGLAQESLDVISPMQINGALMDANGGISNAEVTIRYDNGEYYEYVGRLQTDAEGNFSARLGDGHYQISEVTLDKGQSKAIVNYYFEVKNGKIIVNGSNVEKAQILLPSPVLGTFTDSHGGISNVSFILQKHNGDYYDFFGEVITGTDGQFQVRLSDGLYQISEILLEDEFGGTSVKTNFEVKNGLLIVDGKNQESLTISLPSPISGNVFDELGSISHASLEIQKYNGYYYGHTIWLDSNENGEFTSRLEDGKYKISSVSIEEDNSSALVDITFEIINGVLMLNGKNQDSLDVNLPLPTVLGSLVDEKGLPITYGNVNIRQSDSEGYESIHVTLNENGEFSLRLWDGNYMIRDLSNLEFDYDSALYPHKFSVQNGKLLVNGLNQDQLYLQFPIVNFSGQIMNNGVIVPNAEISIMFPIGDYSYTGVGLDTDVNGNFSYRLGDGTYRINVYVDGMSVYEKDFDIINGIPTIDVSMIDIGRVEQE